MQVVRYKVEQAGNADSVTEWASGLPILLSALDPDNYAVPFSLTLGQDSRGRKYDLEMTYPEAKALMEALLQKVTEFRIKYIEPEVKAKVDKLLEDYE